MRYEWRTPFIVIWSIFLSFVPIDFNFLSPWAYELVIEICRLPHPGQQWQTTTSVREIQWILPFGASPTRRLLGCLKPAERIYSKKLGTKQAKSVISIYEEPSVLLINLIPYLKTLSIHCFLKFFQHIDSSGVNAGYSCKIRHIQISLMR